MRNTRKKFQRKKKNHFLFVSDQRPQEEKRNKN